LFKINQIKYLLYIVCIIYRNKQSICWECYKIKEVPNLRHKKVPSVKYYTVSSSLNKNLNQRHEILHIFHQDGKTTLFFLPNGWSLLTQHRNYLYAINTVLYACSYLSFLQIKFHWLIFSLTVINLNVKLIERKTHRNNLNAVIS
jgi:hypothetical protein